MSRYDWMDQALCAQTDPEIFFDGRYNFAEKLCTACPVRQACEAQADLCERGLDQKYRHGLWAGKTPRGRAGTDTAGFYDARDDHIRQLGAAGWDAIAIAEETNCSTRTVWRVLADQRDSFSEAA
ncbi:WhiB family transcriptional regulator [Streptomyces nojiriensis]|uniref:WhiB family transcriptional regulator n=1 Tax=Streptomyces nojiriensis TaxID=66374 RepID=UPI002E19A09C